MAFAFFPSRPKRKDVVDDVADEFSEFSISAPARKMRRLDADAPVIIGQLKAESSIVFEDADIMSNSMPSCTSNNNMAIVLYKPTESSVPSGVSFWVDKNLISGIKEENKKFWHNSEARTTDKVEEEEVSSNGRTVPLSNRCLAVVPWLPAQIPEVYGVAGSTNLLVEDKMDLGEETDAMLMDVEEGGVEHGSRQAIPMVVSSASAVEPFRGLQQWQQQPCLYPNAPPNASGAVTWSW